ncbi:MAG: hypothetical protein ABJH45_11435 [Paracoccaceae bacterium]
MGESFNTRLEAEIAQHQGQIHAENLLLNTIARYRDIATAKGQTRDQFNHMLRHARYDLAKLRSKIEQIADGLDLDQLPESGAINTADLMRQRAAMMGAVMSSTPILLRDPWDGQPVTAKYGFKDAKATVGNMGFSAVATPRYKGMPYRFAVMKHEHDGFIDHNPAIILSNQFCDAFDDYRSQTGCAANDHPLIRSTVAALKPSVHDRFHNWLLYDTDAKSDAFKAWGDDIFFVDHKDKNPLLINYEQIALCFHLYVHQTLSRLMPNHEEAIYTQFETCIAEIETFRQNMIERGIPQANDIADSTQFLVASNICFVLDPFTARFQSCLRHAPDVHHRIVSPQSNGGGIAHTLRMLHGGSDTVPSLRYGGAKEAVCEYILRYPLVEEIQARQGPRVASSGANAVPEILKGIAPSLSENLSKRFVTDNSGFMFLRLDRSEIDYTSFVKRRQEKRVLLVDIPDGKIVKFESARRASLLKKVTKQQFELRGGHEILAVNIRDKQLAADILEQANTPQGIDPQRVVEEAQYLAQMTGNTAIADLYGLSKSKAQSDTLYGFQDTGFYVRALKKHVASSVGPIILNLENGNDQRLLRGAFVYIPFDASWTNDTYPDCHLMEQRDYQRDYETREPTQALPRFKLVPGNLIETMTDHETVYEVLERLQTHNIVTAHRGDAFAQAQGGIFF